MLASNLPPESRSPKQLVNLYAKCMQIEETFRDLKSPAYGFGLRQSRTNSPERFDIILLIVLMVQCLLWLVGLHAQQHGWDRHFQANTISTLNDSLGIGGTQAAGLSNHGERVAGSLVIICQSVTQIWLCYGRFMRGSLSTKPISTKSEGALMMTQRFLRSTV